MQLLFCTFGYTLTADGGSSAQDDLAWLVAFQDALETNNTAKKNTYLMHVLQNKDMALAFASFRGYVKTVQFLLQLKDINPEGRGKMHPLILAVNKGNIEIVRMLLEKKAQLDVGDRDGATALHMAANFAYNDILALLLDAGADPNTKNLIGATALHVAAHKGNFFALNALLGAGAHVAHDSSCKMTPLSLAVNANHLECVQALLQAGVDPNSVDGDGMTSLMRAAKNSHIACMQFLLDSGAMSNFVNPINGYTALTVAAQYGKVDAAKLLLDIGVNINATNKDGATPLVIAIIAGRPNIVELLLKSGADITVCPNQGHSLLYMLSCSHADAQTIKDICALFQEVKEQLLTFDAADFAGDFAMHHAASRKDAHVLEFLVRSGADINKCNRYGETPLYVAARKGNVQGFKFLCDIGADHTITNCLGLTPIEIAQANGHSTIVSYARNYKQKAGQKVSRQVSRATSSREIENNNEYEQCLNPVVCSSSAVVTTSPISKRSKKVRSRGQRVAVESALDVNDHRKQDTPDIFVLRQQEQEMTVVVYKENNVALSDVIIGNISRKPDKFHAFTSELDKRLGQGIRIDAKNQDQYQELCDELGIRPLTGGQSGIILQGKIEGAYYDARYARLDRGRSSNGLAGAFVYLFDASGTCYHRCFHQNRESIRAHSYGNTQIC